MKGSEHYREAERLLLMAGGADWADSEQPGTFENYRQRHTPHQWLIARAQVHATLALADATAAPLVHKMFGDSTRITDWGHAIAWDTEDLTRHTPRCPAGEFDPHGNARRCLGEPGHPGEHWFEEVPF